MMIATNYQHYFQLLSDCVFQEVSEIGRLFSLPCILDWQRIRESVYGLLPWDAGVGSGRVNL
jgi:hypothetical protein